MSLNIQYNLSIHSIWPMEQLISTIFLLIILILISSAYYSEEINRRNVLNKRTFLNYYKNLIFLIGLLILNLDRVNYLHFSFALMLIFQVLINFQNILNNMGNNKFEFEFYLFFQLFFTLSG